jgi:hypothetical protein
MAGIKFAGFAHCVRNNQRSIEWGFFATMPTVLGNVFGSARVAVAMGMIVTGWAGGYLMVIYNRRVAVIGP